MKKSNVLAKIASLALVFCMVLSIASCGLFGGSLKLDSFAVDRSTVKTNYFVGEDIADGFKNIKAYVTYSDEELNAELTYSNLQFTYPSTDTVGQKQVTVSYNDPNLNTTITTTVDVNILEDPDKVEHKEGEKVMQFQHNTDTIAAFKNDNATVTQNPSDLGFAAHFSVGGQTYVIGDDNEFKMVPSMVSMVDGVLVPRSAYYMDITIEVEVDGNYVILTRTANSETKYTYTLDGKTLATVDAYNGLYKFEEPIAKVRITVLPSASRYTGDAAKTPVTLEATVIDAYNVHNAKQLSVIDNNTYRTDWNALKTEWGVAGIDPVGIVLHSDIKITYKDVPASFFYDAEHAVQYYNTATGEVRNYSEIAGMKYLKDKTFVYKHTGLTDFVIEGNFFTVDTSDFPLVASPSIFENKDKTYGSDYSNASLFCFEGYEEEIYGAWADAYEPTAENVPDITFNNTNFIGNAGMDCWVIQSVDGANIGADNELVTAGGLFLVKSSRFAHTVFNNANTQCFYITYCADYHGDLDLNNVKCYDSYQDAIYTWGDSILNVHNMFMNGAGGPVIMAQSVNRDGVYYNPTVTITGIGNVETHVSGQEAWFKSVDPTGTSVGGILAVSNGLNQFMTAVKGTSCTWIDGDNMMNMKAMIMADGQSAAAAMSDVNSQGSVKIGEFGGIERWRDGDTFWSDVYTAIISGAGAAPFVTVHDAAGNYYTLMFNGNFVDLQGNAVSPATHVELLEAFATADEIIFSMGGMSILFDLYH